MIPSSPPAPGTVVASKYRLERELGRGGMGAVHEATHLVTGQRVALKQLLARYATDAVAVARLLREARIAAQLSHPGIVRVYDVEQHEGSVLLVMELLAGESLAGRLTRGPMSCAESVAMLVPVMKALAYAHAHGVIHRDVKPENVFLHVAGDGLVVPKVLDFGIAKMPEHLVGTGNLTDTRSVMGSPLYMSPEQLRGMKHVDARTDVYSMGVVLFQALAGQVPLRADTFGELVLLITMTPPPPLRALRPDLSPALEAVIARALAKDPAHRFPDMASLAGAFEDAASRPFVASTDTPTVSSTQAPTHARLAPAVAARAPSRSSAFGPIALGGCLFAAIAAVPCAVAGIYVAMGVAVSSSAGGGGLFGAFGGGQWVSPACLTDANGDAVLDVAGLTGSFDSRRLTVIDGVDGSTLWRPDAEYHDGDELFCPRAPALGVSGWVGVARTDFTLDLYSASAHERPVTVRTPDRADAYGVGRGCIAVRSTNRATTGVALPSGQAVSCDAPTTIGILAVGEQPGLGSTWEDSYSVTSGDVVYTITTRSPGTPFLVVTARRAGAILWSTTLGMIGIGAMGTRVMAVTPSTIVVAGSTPSPTHDLVLMGVDARTGAVRYQVPYPGHTFTITSFAYSGRYVMATAPWSGLAAIEPDTGTLAFSR